MTNRDRINKLSNDSLAALFCCDRETANLYGEIDEYATSSVLPGEKFYDIQDALDATVEWLEEERIG